MATSNSERISRSEALNQILQVSALIKSGVSPQKAANLITQSAQALSDDDKKTLSQNLEQKVTAEELRSAISSIRTSNTSYGNSNIIKPTQNPLGNYSSYTYQITLYMSTPEAVNNFIMTGKFDPTNQHYIVAQSGGIGIKEKRAITYTGELGPDQQGMNYYIDDLEIKHVLTGTNGSPTIGTDIKFKIIEPIGFNLFSDLVVASGKINEISAILKESGNKPAPIHQNFMIGIRFYGYDEVGNLVESVENQQFYNQNKKYQLSTKPYSNYEFFFSFQTTQVSYQIDGRVVTYQFEGAPISKQVGHGVKFGLINSASQITAETVEQAMGESSVNATPSDKRLLNSLMDVLFDQEQAKIDTKTARAEKPITYSIDWGDGAMKDLTKPLREAKISGGETSKNMTPTSSVTSTKEVTPKAAVKAQSIDVNKHKVSIKAGSSVLFLMDQIMAKSTYVTDVLTAQNDQAIETKSKENVSMTPIQWYSINPVVKITGRDNITKDWVYHIKYEIRIQQIEYINALYVKNVSPWKGAYKVYNYFLTGQNTEILSFEQKYDTQFYLLQAISGSKIEIRPGNTTPAHLQGGSQDKTTASAENRGSEVAANTAVRMNSIADQAEASIKIMGDPHYLMSNVGGISSFSSERFEQLYNMNMSTMNPYKNQIWIQIKFKGATDYIEDGPAAGTLKTKEVDFYSPIMPPQSEEEKATESSRRGPGAGDGLIYRIIEVTSNFSSGKFTQNLELILVPSQTLNVNTKKTGDESGRSTDAGAGRGRLGGPTAQELDDWRRNQMGAWRGIRNDPIRIDGDPIVSSPEEQLTAISSNDDQLSNKSTNKRKIEPEGD